MIRKITSFHQPNFKATYINKKFEDIPLWDTEGVKFEQIKEECAAHNKYDYYITDIYCQYPYDKNFGKRMYVRIEKVNPKTNELLNVKSVPLLTNDQYLNHEHYHPYKFPLI